MRRSLCSASSGEILLIVSNWRKRVTLNAFGRMLCLAHRFRSASSKQIPSTITKKDADPDTFCFSSRALVSLCCLVYTVPLILAFFASRFLIIFRIDPIHNHPGSQTNRNYARMSLQYIQRKIKKIDQKNKQQYGVPPPQVFIWMEEEEEERGLIKDLKRPGSIAWDPHGSPVPRWT